MTKKIIILIIFSFLMFLILGRINALSIEIIPLKKPILTKEELQKKVLVNILKPLAKPKKIKTQKSVGRKSNVVKTVLGCHYMIMKDPPRGGKPFIKKN